jgi:small subunit ribosomal protein S15
MLKKIELLKSYGFDEKNVGSSAAQIVFINAKIRSVIDHLKENRKDVSAKRSMLKRLARQKTLLAYLKRKNNNIYLNLSSKLQEEKKNLKS